MELSWSTLLLEIINFLVLVWILKRFLYQPLQDVIARRRAGIEKTLADAAAMRTEAEALKAQYEGRLAEWNQERQQSRDALAQELEAERTRRLAELRTALEQEREKVRLADTRRRADESRTIEEKALMQGARFASRLLQQGSGPDTETRLVELVLAELAQLPDDRLAALRSNYEMQPEPIVVSSAFRLPDDQCERLRQALTAIVDTQVEIRFEQDEGLLAGLRVVIGAWDLGINLRDELAGFTGLTHGD